MLVETIIHVTDKVYLRTEVLQMESHVLNTVVTIMDFLARFLKAGGITPQSTDKRPFYFAMVWLLCYFSSLLTR